MSSRPPITAHCPTVESVSTMDVTAGSSCIWLISNEAQMHYDTTVGYNLEALVKDGGIQQLDIVDGHSD